MPRFQVVVSDKEEALLSFLQDGGLLRCQALLVKDGRLGSLVVVLVFIVLGSRTLALSFRTVMML